MKNKYNIIFLLCISLLISSASFAGLEIKAASPQAVDGNISFAEADSFQIDILINITDENSELCGGGFAFELFSPDKSIESITHLTVTDGYASTESIEYLNGFNTDIFNVATITCENGWGGNGDSKSIGDLPDSISFVLAGIGCLSSSLPDQEYIRFNLRCSNPGTICIDSISNSADDLWDWLFESRWDPVTFDGPYCWTILSQSNDTPPDITCPGDVTIESGSSTDPSNTGEPEVTDYCETGPIIITYDDNIVSETTIIRTWTATDHCGNSATCEQIITLDYSTDITDTDGRALPENYALSQNYPNPFNPRTNIELALPKASNWNISIYNVIGQKVKEYSGFDEAGYVTINWDATGQSSGMYFYKATAGGFSDTRKMILLK